MLVGLELDQLLSITLIHKPIIDMNNIKKCNQCLLEKATSKIWDQKQLTVTMEKITSYWVGLKSRNVFAPSPS